MAKRFLAIFCGIALLIIAGFLCFKAVSDFVTYFPHQSFWKNVGTITVNILISVVLVVSSVILFSKR